VHLPVRLPVVLSDPGPAPFMAGHGG